MKLNRPLPKHIQEIIDQGGLVFCSHSGGKDSQAMYLYLKDKVPANQLRLLHSDLGKVEWKGVQEHIRNTIDHPLTVVKPNRNFFEMVRKRGMWPSPKYRECTQTLKTSKLYQEIRRQMSEADTKLGLNCTGIRAEESPARAKKEQFYYNKKLTIWDRYDCPNGKLDKKGRVKRYQDFESPKEGERKVWDYLPIFDWTVEEVFQAIKDCGERPHWAYEAGMTRLSCMVCIMSSKTDLKTAAKNNPGLLDQYEEIEKEIDHTMFMKGGKPIGIKEYVGDYEEHEAPNLFEMLTEEKETTEQMVDYLSLCS